MRPLTTKTPASRFSRVALCRGTLLASLLLVAHTSFVPDVHGQEPPSWPLLLEGEQADIVLYEPQVESFAGNQLEARGAVSVTRKGSNKPIFGAVWLKAEVATDLEARTVSLVDLEVTAARFPDIEESQVAVLKNSLESELPHWDLTFSLDVLLASLEKTRAEADASQLHNDPPEIIYSEQPAVLVLIDGEPRFASLEGSDLEYVLNSTFYIVRDHGRLYLRGGDQWFTAPKIDATWSVARELPRSVQELTAKIEEEESQRLEEESQAAAASGESVEAPEGESNPSEAAPLVFVRTRPAELIFTDGPADFAPLTGTQLLYMKNTESDVFMDIAEQQYYVVLAGRWYRSASLSEGPWFFVEPDALPEDFGRISEGSDMANVLPSVPGTLQAQEAVLENSIPQTAVVDRKTATLSVQYDGEPEFERCADNGVAYARNTDKSVLLIDGRYYACDSAVWFESNGPSGPWTVADKIPDAVQGIPPDCPVYNVKYVTIYDSTPDVVYVGYTPGYVGSYVHGGVVVYGTGYWYHPWVHTVYYPRPVTYGFHAHYSPWTGWGFTFGMSYGWLHISVGRPYYGGCWGPMGYHYGYRRGYMHGYAHGYAHGYSHGYRHGAAAGYAAGRRQTSSNIYKNRGNGIRATGREEVARDRHRAAAAGRTSRDAARRPSTDRVQKKQPRSAGKRDDVYADRQGNTYRKDGDQWQQRDNKSNEWSKPAGKPDAGVQRDQQSRQRQKSATQNRQHARPQQKSHPPQPRQRSGGGRKRGR